MVSELLKRRTEWKYFSLFFVYFFKLNHKVKILRNLIMDIFFIR